jgi:hypothetical protein
VRLGGGENEDDVGRRLLQGLEEGVEGGLREHVDLVYEVNLVLAGGGEGYFVAQAANLVNAAVAGGIELDQVHGAAREEVEAVLAAVAGLTFLAVGAVEGLAEEAAG